MKESCVQEDLCKHFQSEGHKEFVNKASATFIDKTNVKDPKKSKILDANIENNGNFWS